MPQKRLPQKVLQNVFEKQIDTTIQYDFLRIISKIKKLACFLY